MKFSFKKSFLFDLFIILCGLLAVAIFYFSWIHPIRFSGKIGREAAPVYAQVDLISGPELFWLKDKIAPGTQSSLVYGQLEWEVLEIKPFGNDRQQSLMIRLKMRLSRTDDGRIWYHKYLFRIGDTLVVTNPEYVIRGWIYGYHLLDETGTF